MNHATVIPLWIGLPIAGVLMLAVAAHAIALAESDHPASRKRIRQANAVMILLTIPLLTAGFCIVDPNMNPREWTLVWIASMAMLGFVVFLAVLDMINTMRLTRQAKRRLKQDLGRPSPRPGRAMTPSTEGHDDA